MALNGGSFHRHDFTKLHVRDIYALLIAAIVPRPIAFITTINNSGVTNLAPFSFFNGVSSNPPCLVVSIARKADGTKKDTLLNIEANGEFVVNSAEDSFVHEVNASSKNFPHGVSELEQVGLHSLPSDWVRPPRVSESAIQMECRLEKLVELGSAEPGSATLVVGRILGLHVANRVIENGEIQYEKLNPIARLGRDQWLRGGEIFRMPRP